MHIAYILDAAHLNIPVQFYRSQNVALYLIFQKDLVLFSQRNIKRNENKNKINSNWLHVAEFRNAYIGQHKTYVSIHIAMLRLIQIYVKRNSKINRHLHVSNVDTRAWLSNR